MTADESSGSNTGEQPVTGASDAHTPQPGAPEPQTPEAAPPDQDAPQDQTEEPEGKLSLTVEIEDVAPCKKHLRVEVDRTHVDEKLGEALDQLVDTSQVPGFRQGRAPKALVAKRFRREMGNQVKGELVAAAFEQALEEHDLTLLSQPDMKLEDIQLLDEGPLTFEAEIQVRPQFEIPAYDRVEIQRPRVEVTDGQIDEAMDSLRDRNARLVPKADEPAEAGDVLVADLTLTLADRTVKQDHDVNVRVAPTARLRDMSLEDFQDAMVGVRAGEQRVCEATISDQYGEADLQGKRVQCTVAVKDVKRVDRPELDAPMLQQMGFASVDELRNEFRRRLDRQQQRESLSTCRQQVYDHLLKQADWDLPDDLVAGEAERLASRRRLDLMMAGVPEAQIDQQADALIASSHERAVGQLKAYFILDKIAQKEGVTVEASDVDAQIRSLATGSNESPRRVRARLEKQDRMGLLEIQILEQKTVDRILQDAVFTDVSREEYAQESGQAAGPVSDTEAEPTAETPPEPSEPDSQAPSAP